MSISLREMYSSTEFFLVRIFLYSIRIQENTDQKKLRIWTLFTQCLSKKRIKLLLQAQKYVENVGEVQFVNAYVNCNLKVNFRNNEENFFTSMQGLEDILDKKVSLLIGC